MMIVLLICITLANKSLRLELLIIYFLCKFATPYQIRVGKLDE